MKQLKIAGKPPQTVVGSVTDRNGEDFIGVNTVPSVGATFLVSEPSVVAAQTETHTDLNVKSYGSLSIWPQAGSGEAKGLKEQITTAGDASYYVIYFFKTPVAYTPADSDTCSTTPTPRECTDGYIIDTMHLVSQPVSVIRLGV